MKKYLLVLFILTFLFAALTLPTLAAEGEVAEEYVSDANVFELIYDEILLHSDKILSALAFVASLLLAFTYKKGLLPLLKGALSSLGSSVSTLKEETEKAKSVADEGIKAAISRLESAEALILSLTDTLSTVEAELCEARTERAHNADMRTVMRAQVDMLYEIFMSSSLPLYQKEAVGEKISEMKKALLTDGEEEENV